MHAPNSRSKGPSVKPIICDSDANIPPRFATIRHHRNASGKVCRLKWQIVMTCTHLVDGERGSYQRWPRRVWAGHVRQVLRGLRAGPDLGKPQAAPMTIRGRSRPM